MIRQFPSTYPFTRGGTLVNTVDTISPINCIVWYATVPCRVVAVRGYRVGGDASTTINARRNGSATKHLSSDLTLTNADTWYSNASVQDTEYAVGDKLEIMVVGVGGTKPTQVAIQVDFVTNKNRFV